jgi:hypothetical protein
MKSMLMLTAVVLGSVVFLGVTQNLNAADEKGAKAQPAFNQEEMMKKMMEMGTPGPQHKEMQKMVGEWDCEVTEYPMFPGMKETVSKGKAEFEAKFGGRFIEQEFESEFNGMKYEGIGLLGYDNSKKVYFSTWMDNMSTQLMHAEGTMDEKTHSLIENAETNCPLGKMKNKMVTTWKSDDEFTFVMHAQMEGTTEMKKMMQIVYKRKK